MAEGMRDTVDLNGLPTLMAAAFLFGIVHAFMPGHGKIVLVSYITSGGRAACWKASPRARCWPSHMSGRPLCSCWPVWL
jgi:hypothetical protein